MRHPSVTSLLHWLTPNPNLPQSQLDIAFELHQVAITMVNSIPNDNQELTTGLRKLLEAKDCFVRASLQVDGQ